MYYTPVIIILYPQLLKANLIIQKCINKQNLVVGMKFDWL